MNFFISQFSFWFQNVKLMVLIVFSLTWHIISAFPLFFKKQISSPAVPPPYPPLFGKRFLFTISTFRTTIKTKAGDRWDAGGEIMRYIFCKVPMIFSSEILSKPWSFAGAVGQQPSPRSAWAWAHPPGCLQEKPRWLWYCQWIFMFLRLGNFISAWGKWHDLLGCACQNKTSSKSFTSRVVGQGLWFSKKIGRIFWPRWSITIDLYEAKTEAFTKIKFTSSFELGWKLPSATDP